MKIYRVTDETRLLPTLPLGLNNVQYFTDRDRALREGEKLARIYAAMNDLPSLTRHDVNRYDILTVWQDAESNTDTNIMIKVEEGEVEL